MNRITVEEVYKKLIGKKITDVYRVKDFEVTDSDSCVIIAEDIKIRIWDSEQWQTPFGLEINGKIVK